MAIASDIRKAAENLQEASIVPATEEEAYELADRIDAELIARSLAGVPVDILCYKFRTSGGQVVSGVTAKGALVLAAAMARQGKMHLTELEPEIEDRGETYYVKVAVKNLDNDVTFYGVAEASKLLQRKDGTTEPDRFALAKAHAVARRRAIMAHFAGEEKLIQAFVEEQQRQGKTVVSAQPGGVIAQAALEQRRAAASYVPTLGREEQEQVAEAMREAGVTKNQVAAYIFRRFGARKLAEVPADRLGELLAWIREQAPGAGAEAAEPAEETSKDQEEAAEQAAGEAEEPEPATAGGSAATEQIEALMDELGLPEQQREELRRAYQGREEVLAERLAESVEAKRREQGQTTKSRKSSRSKAREPLSGNATPQQQEEQEKLL